MRKIIFLVSAFVFAAMLAIPASAVTEQDILNALRSGIDVNGQIKEIPAHQIKTVEDFLAANNLSDEDLSFAMTEIEAVKAVWSATGKINFTDIPRSTQDQLITRAQAAAKRVNATLTYSGNQISIVDENNRTYTITVQGKLGTLQSGALGIDGTSAMILSLTLGAAVLFTAGTSLAISKRKAIAVKRA
ncbi:MAG: hypothetical protein FWH14_03715 [Oscillospiraceae bacterium]|nr:hypothetical protein [Oscillospiraceae bacterium]